MGDHNEAGHPVQGDTVLVEMPRSMAVTLQRWSCNRPRLRDTPSVTLTDRLLRDLQHVDLRIVEDKR